VADQVPSELPAGTVVDTQPGPYSQHPSGASVALIVSNGSPPRPDPPDNDNGRPGDDGPGNGDDQDDGPGGGNGNGDGDELQVPDPADILD
jgi:hypothetical protein